MIIHFLEVWLIFLVVFAAGCGLGVALHAGLAAGPLAGAQEAFAGALGDAVDRLKWRLGMAPDWRPELRRSRSWPAQVSEDRPHWEARFQPADPEWPDDRRAEGEGWPEEADLPDDDVVADVERALRQEDPTTSDAAGREEATDAVYEAQEMMRPAALSAPRAGVPDNLQKIWGIGKRNEALLHSLGIFHFGQIAAWTPAEARWVAARLTFPERLERDNWIGQAIVLATGGDPSTVSPSNRAPKKAPKDDAS